MAWFGGEETGQADTLNEGRFESWFEDPLAGLSEGQRQMHISLMSIFPDAVHCVNYRDEDLRFSNGRQFELDAFFPELMLAFEYQGEQHYTPVEPWGGEEALKRTIKRDTEKRALCSSHGILLVEVPFTWNRVDEHLLQIIKDERKRFNE
jgi:hypothetical protein